MKNEIMSQNFCDIVVHALVFLPFVSTIADNVYDLATVQC